MSLKSLLRRIVPASWRPWIRRYHTRAYYFGLARRCNICGGRWRSFLPHGIDLPPAYHAEPDFLCPMCRSKPPHRLVCLYLDAHQELFVRGGLLVHVAPEHGFGPRLANAAAAHGMCYRSGDIRAAGDAHLDIVNMPFPDGSVSLFYCCHVLNSLQDDRAALREVFRVLHPNGLAILQVPAFYSGKTTQETNSAEERMAVFGDDGIYRNYTDDDFRNRLRATGFEVSVFSTTELPPQIVGCLQLKREFVHLCRKSKQA